MSATDSGSYAHSAAMHVASGDMLIVISVPSE